MNDRSFYDIRPCKNKLNQASGTCEQAYASGHILLINIAAHHRQQPAPSPPPAQS